MDQIGRSRFGESQQGIDDCWETRYGKFLFFFFDCPTQFGIRTVPRLVNPNDAGSYGVVASPHLKRRSVFGSQPTRFSWGKKSINLPEYASIDPRGRRAE